METFTTSLTCERSMTKTAVGAVLRAILFQRAFGTVKPTTSRVCGVELPSIDAADLIQTVAARADEVYRAIEQQQASGSTPRQVDVVVSFKEEKTRRTWYSTVSEEVPWEQWRVNVKVLIGQTERERNRIDDITKADLKGLVLKMLTFADSHREHTPAISSNDILPFPWAITVKATSRDDQLR